MVFGDVYEVQPRPTAIKFEPRSAKLEWRKAGRKESSRLCDCACIFMFHGSWFITNYHYYSEEGDKALCCCYNLPIPCGFLRESVDVVIYWCTLVMCFKGLILLRSLNLAPVLQCEWLIHILFTQLG